MKSGLIQVRGSGALLWLCAITVLAGCSSPPELAFHFEPGDSKTIQSDQEEMLNMGPINLDAAIQSRQVLHVEDVAEDGTATIRVDYESVNYVLQGGSAFGRFNSDTDDIPIPLKDVMEAMEGASLTLIVNPKGRIESIQGVSELQEHVKSNMGSSAMMPEVAVGQLVTTLISKDQLMESYTHIFPGYPESPVRVGDTWESTYQGDVRIDSEYKLLETTPTAYTIEITSRIDESRGADASINGTKTVTISIDPTTGWPKTASGTGELQGKMGPLDMDVKTQYDTTIF